MKIVIHLFLFSISLLSWGQTDYSDKWEDLFSYNNVKDFYNTDTHTIALSENAIFIYDKQEKKYEKISSVNGLIGRETSALYFDATKNLIVIGYEDGSLEIIDENREITLKPEIKDFNITGSKRINHIKAYGTDLILSTSFGIVTFDLEELEYKDTYYIGFGSTEVVVHETEIVNNTLYAATESGLYYADINNSFLNDYNNWTQFQTNDFSNIVAFNNTLYVAKQYVLYSFNGSALSILHSLPATIYDLTSDGNTLTATTKRLINSYDENIQLIQSINAANLDQAFFFAAQTAKIYQNKLYIATRTMGVLNTERTNTTHFEKVCPEGPISNKPFSITAANENLWVVYGGYDNSYLPINKTIGPSHYNGENWVNIPYGPTGVPVGALVQVTIDPSHENRVYISSYGAGIVILENDTFTTHWDNQNSGLERIISQYSPVRIGGTAFDDQGNLWVTNIGVNSIIKKYNPSSGNWRNYNLGSLNTIGGLNEIHMDKSGNKWIGTNIAGAIVINKNENKFAAFTTAVNTGNIPHNDVRSIAIDNNNRTWIGTRNGLVTYNNSASFFELSSYAAKPVVLAYGEDDNIGEALLGSQPINAICVDGADNKWFGTNNGILQTNSSGFETLAIFNTNNSPLPSDRILDIEFDSLTGKIYFATEEGIVAYSSNVSPYGEHLESAYAYPNPVKKQHDFVTIDGRNGSHLPNGTNVKILDVAGKLVYETNVKEGQEQYGGKVVWNKTNLAGQKVASGIYIVLLTIKDASETAMTKIAIIN